MVLSSAVSTTKDRGTLHCLVNCMHGAVGGFQYRATGSKSWGKTLLFAQRASWLAVSCSCANRQQGPPAPMHCMRSHAPCRSSCSPGPVSGLHVGPLAMPHSTIEWHGKEGSPDDPSPASGHSRPPGHWHHSHQLPAGAEPACPLASQQQRQG